MQNKKKLIILIAALAVLAVAAFLFIRRYKPQWQQSQQTKKELKPGAILPEKLQAIPDVFNAWPVEKEKIISNFSLGLPQPVDTQYTLVYQSAKSFSDVLNSYQKAFGDKKLTFRQEDNSDAKNKIFSQALSANLEQENAALSVKAEMTDKVLVTLVYTKYLSDFKIKALPQTAPTFRQDTANLALPKNFPANFPLPSGATIIQSYNLINTETGAAKEADIVLTSSKPVDEIKSFYVSKLKAPGYKAIANAGGLVFTDSAGILSIAVSAEAGSAIIKISQDILVPLATK